MVPDARQSAAYEVNQRETIVGQSLILEADGVTTTWRATRWVQGTSGWTAELIPTLHDSRHSASAINSLGQMAGGSPTATGEERFYSFDGTTVVDRGGLGGPAEVGGINVDGTIVGSVGIPKDRAAVSHVNELPVLLPDLGGQASFATAINDLGVIVGSAMNPAGEFRAVRWTRSPTTGNYVVEDLGLSRGRAFSINNEGEIVGSFVTSRGERGFYRSKSGAIKELPMISYASIAYAINESGQVTGTSWVRRSDAHAVLWTNVR